MRSQTVIASRRNIRYQPYAFTEHGVAMLSAVPVTLQQHAAILVSVVQDIQKSKNPPVTRAIGFIARSPKKK